MQPIIVDPEVMCDLVYDGDPDFVDDLLVGLANRQDRITEDQNVIRQAGIGLATFGKWNT